MKPPRGDQSSFPRPLLALAVLAVALRVGVQAQTSRGGVTWAPWEEAFDRAATTGQPVLAWFEASWCGPCRMMERTTWRDASVRETLESRFVAARVDVDERKDLAEAHQVESMPTLVVFDAQGRELARFRGARPPSVLLEDLARLGAE